MKKSHLVACIAGEISPSLTLDPTAPPAPTENRMVRVSADNLVFATFRAFHGLETARNLLFADHPGKAGRGPAGESTRKRTKRYSRDPRQDVGQQRSRYHHGLQEELPENTGTGHHTGTGGENP